MEVIKTVEQLTEEVKTKEVKEFGMSWSYHVDYVTISRDLALKLLQQFPIN